MRTYLHAVEALVHGAVRTFIGRSDLLEHVPDDDFARNVLTDSGVDSDAAIVLRVDRVEVDASTLRSFLYSAKVFHEPTGRTASTVLGRVFTCTSPEEARAHVVTMFAGRLGVEPFELTVTNLTLTEEP